MTMPNVDLMQQVLDHITAHPEQHDQDRWGMTGDCGTTACFAGWTRILVEADPWLTLDLSGDRILAHGTGDKAQEYLGLNDEQANVLFHDAADLVDVWHVCAEITDGAITVPSGLLDADKMWWAQNRLEWAEDEA